jgi:type IV secretion system protein VirB6
MIIYSLLVFFRATLEVIIGYCLAFLSLAVLISLAPFFITFMLFEQTKGLFDNWLSLLFSYMIQPTILLIFFLLIDQIVSPHILLTVSKACWGTLIPIEVGLDLRALGIPISFAFSLPFLPGIPFFITEVAEVQNVPDIFSNPQGTILTVVTGSLLFYSFCLMAKGLVAYMTVVIAMLTNVSPARTSGQGQSSDNQISSVTGDLDKVAGQIKGIARAGIKQLTGGSSGDGKEESNEGGTSRPEGKKESDERGKSSEQSVTKTKPDASAGKEKL